MQCNRLQKNCLELHRHGATEIIFLKVNILCWTEYQYNNNCKKNWSDRRTTKQKNMYLLRLLFCTSRSNILWVGLFFYHLYSHTNTDQILDSWFAARYDIMQCDITSLWGKSALTRLEREHIAMQGFVWVCVCMGTWHHSVITAHLRSQSCASWSRDYVRKCHASRAAVAVVVVVVVALITFLHSLQSFSRTLKEEQHHGADKLGESRGLFFQVWGKARGRAAPLSPRRMKSHGQRIPNISCHHVDAHQVTSHRQIQMSR